MADAEEKKLSMNEVRITIATSLATAFGFVIGLLWNNVVVGGLNVAGISPTLSGTDATVDKWAIFVITAVIITVVMVLMIILVSRWGGKKT